MMARRCSLVVLAIASLGLCGCPLLWLGAGAAGGYAISKDSVRNAFDLSPGAVYHSSLSVIKGLGMVTAEDASHGLIQAKVGDVNVTITVKPLTKKTVELKVKARNRFLMPRVDVAQEVYTKIVERL